MFEGVLESVLDKVLGEFVQDIDSKNLKLAVWSGNVVLKNLRLKAEALAKLDLPVFVFAGLIGSLELQVPWKALWTSPTKVSITNVVLLVVPKDAAPYNEEKAKKEERAKKQAMLTAVEEAQERLQVQGKNPGKQTWAESLITAIIKNLEIKIENIHVRYEDPISKYAMGCTLDKLYAMTTDEMWRPAVMSESSSTLSRIFKLARIENFCVYWNSPTALLFDMPQSEIEAELLKRIVTQDNPNHQHNFIIHPMGMEVKIIIDPSNKIVMDIPKASLSVHFSSLTTEVRRIQYQNTMSLIDAMECGKKKQPFAKWHPGVPIKGHAREWWDYLHRYCIESRVKRKILCWRWSNILKHRLLCKDYTQLRTKQIVGKPALTLNELTRVQDAFDTLDIVNITICEQIAKREAEKIKSSQGSWFGGWWGGGSARKESVVDKFGLTKEEKAAFTSAIESSEAAAANQIYPQHYVKLRFRLTIDKVSFKLNDNVLVIAEAAVKGISSEVNVIPYGNGISVIYSVQTAYIVSNTTNILTPSDNHGMVALCEGRVHINPSDNPADITVFSKFSSVTALLDFDLMNAVLDFTKTEQELTDFDQLRLNIEYYSNRLKSQGKSGLMYAIEKRNVVDVNVELSAPKIILPESGKLEEGGPLLVADLGRLILTTEVGVTRSPKELMAMSLAELEETAYDNYLLNLENFHVKLYASKDELDNDIAMSMNAYVVCPIRLKVNVSVSILPDDKKLPKIKCKGHLDSVVGRISDSKIKNLYRILDSLPKNEPSQGAKTRSVSSVIAETDLMDLGALAQATSFVTAVSGDTPETIVSPTGSVSTPISILSTESSDDFYDAPDHFISEDSTLLVEPDGMVVSQTVVSAEFSLNCVALDVFKEGLYENKVVVRSLIKGISATYIKTTWMQRLDASLGEISLVDCLTMPQNPIQLVSSPPNGTLIAVTVQLNDPTSPYFESDFHHTEMVVSGTFDRIAAKLHIESFLMLYEFGMDLLPQSEEQSTEEETEAEKRGSGGPLKPSPSLESVAEDLVKIHVHATMNNVTLGLESAEKVYAEIIVADCDAEVIMKADTMQVTSSLRSLDIKQPSASVSYNTILTVDSQYDQLIHFKMVQYNRKLNMLDPDMVLSVRMGSLHFIFLNSFISNVLHILDIFCNARDKMLAASIETAKLAQESSNSSLISLEVEIESPVIKVPRNGKSADGYKVNMGNILLKNSFKLSKEGVIKDKIAVQLSNIAVSRVVLGGYGDVLRERDILEPYEMELSVSRQLSESSDIDVSVKLAKITANLGYEDYHMLLKTLEENFSETGDRVVSHAPAEEQSAAAVEQAADSTAGGNVRVSLAMGAVVCMLHQNEKQMDISDCKSGKRTSETVIVYSEVRKLAASVTLAADGSKRIEARLWDVRVEDTDPAIMECGVQRILAHRQLANEEAEIITSLSGTSSAIPARRNLTLTGTPHPVVDMGMDMSDMGDMVITCKVSDPHVVVSWGFIQNIITFFTVSPFNANTDESSGSTLSENSGPHSSSSEGESPPSNTTIQVMLTVENPEIAFLSNHASYKTQALLLRTGVDLKYTQMADQTNLSISVDQVTMFICQYLYRLSSIYLLLQPCDLALHYNKVEGEKESVNLDISELVFNISPESLHVMMVVSTQFSSGETVKVATKEHTAYAYNLWNMETIGAENRWYIRQATGNIEHMTGLLTNSASSDWFQAIEPLGQILVVNMNKFKLTLEADYEPLIVVSGSAVCSVKDWGGAMLCDVDLHLEANYYSYNLGTFEPMVEPVEGVDEEYRQWNMTVLVTKCPVEVSREAAHLMQMFGTEASSEQGDNISIASSDSTNTMDILDNAPPLYDIHVTSPDKLMLTITNSALKNFKVLSEAWSTVSDDMTIEPKAITPLMIHNLCGIDVIIRGKQTGSRNQTLPELRLSHEEKQSLNLETFGIKRTKDRSRRQTRTITRERSTTNVKITDAASINIQIAGFEDIPNVKIVQAGIYLYGLVPLLKASAKRERNVLVEVTVVRSSKTVTIRSPLNFHNLQRKPVRLWYSAPDDSTNKEMVAKINPGEKHSVPLDAAICSTADSHHFHISPDDDNYLPSFPAMATCNLKKDGHHFVASHAVHGVQADTILPHHATFSMHPLNVRNPNRLNLDNALYHTIFINPAMMICNKLPVALRVVGAGSDLATKDIAPGCRGHFDEVDPYTAPCLRLRIVNYHDMGFDWSGEFTIDVKKFQENSQQFVTMSSNMNNLTNKVTLGVIAKVTDGLCLTVHSTYWMVNCTGKTLRYQGLHDTSEIIDPPSIQQPMMFSFLHTDKAKQKLRVKVNNANWSDYFSIETVGSGGSIISYDENTGTYYEVGVVIQMSNIQLTNIVTFYPRFQVINELEIPISVRGEHSENLVECKCNKITPFWPGTKEHQSLVICIGKGRPTMAIPLDVTQQTVVRADCSNDEVCGYVSVVVFVDVRTASTEIRVGMYYKGAAPVRIENLLSESKICFKQHSAMSAVTLAPNRSILYTWDFPAKKRELYWCVEGDEKNEKRAEFIKDNCVSFVYHDLCSQRQRRAQVVSFLDGLQRVLLFTDKPAIADCVGQEVIRIEQSQLVLDLRFVETIGISLVDSIPQEVTYMEFQSSGAIWERKLKNKDRYKYLSTKVCAALELALESDKTVVEFDDYSFDKTRPDEMTLTDPKQNTYLVRRTYLPALSFVYTLSASQNNIHFKMNMIQIDNQLADYTFRHVFFPISPPSHAIAESPPKPFIEFSMVKQTTAVEGDTDQSVLDHYKYVKMLVQEFHVKVDAGFLLSLMNFFKVDDDSIIETEKLDLEWLEEDLKMSRTALNDRQTRDDGGPPIFLDEFHLSPLKIHISFSPQMFIDTTQVQVTEDTLALYLRSFGLGLVAINDAVLKLAYYDAAGQLCTLPQLQDRVIKHYIHQSLTQLYAVVFGLDIIGNPYSVAMDIKTGTKDLFYEPYMGIVQGPREFGEGLVIGVNSFLRHSVGGVVGAASKISRSLGKGLAKLTFDESYQKQRTRRMAQKPSHFGEGLARGTKSFLMGLYHGVTGVVVKPVEGAAAEGVGGFFKGVGKGLVGAVARPLGGINDMITYTIDGIHHHTQFDDQIQILRHPRYIQPDKILRPYNTKQSEGKYLLQQAKSSTPQWADEYFHHSCLSKKSVFLLTDNRCLLLQYDDILNHWKVEWSHVYNEIVKVPEVLDEGDGLGIVFSAYMDPNVGFSKFFKERRKKTRIIILQSRLETQKMTERMTELLRRTNKKRFNEDDNESCWNKCCRCL